MVAAVDRHAADKLPDLLQSADGGPKPSDRHASQCLASYSL